MRLLLSWVVVATIATASGCMSLPSPIVINNPDHPGNTSFSPLRDVLRGPTHNLRILVVHGMSPHRIGYSADFQRHLASELKLYPDSIADVIDTLKTTYGSMSFVRRSSYYGADGEVRIYELTWSDLSQRFISARLGYDSVKYGAGRVYLDRRVKQDLINRAFGDAITYSGTFAPTMRRSVARAICVMMTDGMAGADGARMGCTFAPNARIAANTAPAPVALISHSLGSMMVFETLSELAGKDTVAPEKISAADFVKNLRLVAMFANQLPLLKLSRLAALDTGVAPSPFAFLRQVPAAIPILAVSDPNDLLTYPLDTGWVRQVGGPGAQVINVAMANTNKVAVAIVNPGSAHTGYFDNPCAVRLLVSGAPKCSVARIFGVHYENPGRMQLDAGFLLRSNSHLAFPVYGALGVSSIGMSAGVSARKATYVVQLRPSLIRTWGRPVGAKSGETLVGAGIRVSAFTFTAGIDELRNTTTHKSAPRISLGTGW